MKISDDKALSLHDASNAAKRTVGLDGPDLPEWTESFELALAKMTVAQIDEVARLLRNLPTHVAFTE
jgi:hypothetical protein